MSDNHLLGLDRRQVALDLDQIESGFAPVLGHNVEILEGFDIGDQDFEDWLREQRQHIEGRIAAAHASPSALSGDHLENGELAVSSPNVLLLGRGTECGTSEGSFLANSLLDSIAKTMEELGSAEVLDRRDGQKAGAYPAASMRNGALLLSSNSAGAGDDQMVRFVLARLPENALVWSSMLRRENPHRLDISHADTLRSVNQAVYVAVDQFAQARKEAERRSLPADLCRRAIVQLFKLGRSNFHAADELFSQAFELEPRGVFLAWRAYLRTFLLAERQFSCRQTIDEEALSLSRRALAMEPHNSYVAALSAHVHSMMRRSYVAAYELAERSIQLNPANPIGWACLGIAKCYLGKSEEGFRNTVFAREIAGSAPFRYQLDGLSCIAGTMAGQFEKAIYFGESSHALAPEFAPPLRYLSALYLHSGQHEESHRVVEKLRLAEPDFSYERLRDKAYPAAGLHRTSILDLLPQRQI